MTPEIQKLQEDTKPEVIAPKVINQFIKTRYPNTNYIGGGNTLDCDTMLEVEWNGKRYRIPAFIV